MIRKMLRLRAILFSCLFMGISGNISAQDSLMFKGQLSAWVLYNGSLDLPVYMGGRYIPQLNYEINLKNDHLIDFEASANLNGNFGFRPFDTIRADGMIKPYRLWGRYSSRQFEVRVGLQKINFGSAQLIRPLMWFDEVDPRDPLGLTDGVWGGLFRYYFLNNANLWFWSLYGNKNPRGWDFAGTHRDIPEFGGRFQSPIPEGEAAISFHHRVSDTRGVNPAIPEFDMVRENRIGLDVKVDLVVGAWLEGSWVHNSEDLDIFSNQEIFSAGLDYTFGVGNGIYLIFEQLLASYDEKAFAFENTNTFSLLSLSYPLGLFSNIQGIVYFDWDHTSLYNFINLQRDFSHFSLYLMAYWNPEDYRIPTQEIEQNLYAGKGIQIMFVLNH
jgi:hypothetical protein